MNPDRFSLLILGATGLVGSALLHKALADPRVTRVIAPTRRPLSSHPKLTNPVTDFERLPESCDWWSVDAVACALGTTMARAGSQAAFRKVDLDLPLHIAQGCRRAGAQTFVLNSALGADAHSRVFYSRVKGELEERLRALGYPSLTFVQPGLLGGHRQESRPAEKAGILIANLLAPILPRRYRVVPAERVAHHLLEAALRHAPGVTVIPSEALH